MDKIEIKLQCLELVLTNDISKDVRGIIEAATAFERYVTESEVEVELEAEVIEDVPAVRSARTDRPPIRQ